MSDYQWNSYLAKHPAFYQTIFGSECKVIVQGRADERTGRTAERTDGRTDGWTDGRTDGRMEGLAEVRTDGGTEERTEGQKDLSSHMFFSFLSSEILQTHRYAVWTHHIARKLPNIPAQLSCCSHIPSIAFFSFADNEIQHSNLCKTENKKLHQIFTGLHRVNLWSRTNGCSYEHWTSVNIIKGWNMYINSVSEWITS